jgi:2-methylaconitate cis-trans-isomerase PrpF
LRTSRALILLEHDLLASRQRDRILLSLIAGDGVGDGLGGDHYQSNKIAVIHPLPESSSFSFEFYQVDVSTRTILPSMECANVAAGAGLAAAWIADVQPDRHRIVRALNTSTGRCIELTAPLGNLRAAGNWSVRFLSDPERLAVNYTPEPLMLTHSDGRTVEFWVVEEGNLFVFANAVPEAAEPELVEQLSAYAASLVASSGKEYPAAPKIIFYGVTARALDRAEVRACCFFNGEMHHSLPGSASMALSRFLAEIHLFDMQSSDLSGELAFHLVHPSGSLMTCLQWEKAGSHHWIHSTEFTTPVKLLFWGAVPITV